MMDDICSNFYMKIINDDICSNFYMFFTLFYVSDRLSWNTRQSLGRKFLLSTASWVCFRVGFLITAESEFLNI